MTRPPISVVIPTWSALRFLPACLSALRAQLTPQDEIILVDNNSRDRAGDWARSHALDVQVISLPENLGFAGGTNAGIQASRGELLLLINDDALAEPGCVDALWQALHNNPQAGAAAGALLFSRRPELVASAGIVFQGDGVAIDLHLGTPLQQMPKEPVEIFGASGGLALLRREMLAEVGLFAGEFFNYLEDADLAWRARLCGWGAVLAPAARVRHVYSATAGQGSPFKQRLLGRNRLRLIVRCLPGPILSTSLPAILRYDLLAVAYGLLRGQPAIASGRAEALRELPTLLAQRRTIQATRTAPINELAAWVTPAPSPFEALRIRRRLSQILI
jgi:GT2 family glycosyltransferase